MEDTPDPLDSAGHGEPLWKRPTRVSKSEAIRRMAREMVSMGQPPRPKDIVAELGKQGIVVLSSQVSTALSSETFTGKPKATKRQRADRKEPGRAISKSKTIRLMAREMVSRGQPPRPKDIVMELRKQGIVVLSSQVSTALRETEFALRQLRVDWDRPPIMCPDPAQALRLVGLEDVMKANEFAIEIGSFEKAMAALVALRQFGGGDIAVVSQTPTPPSIPTPTPVPPMNKTMEAEMEALEQHRSGS